MKFTLSWNSIRIRLSTLLTLTVAGLGLVLAIFAYLLIRSELEDNLKFFALHEAQEVAIVITDFSSAEDIRENKARFNKIFPEKNVMALQVWSKEGSLIFEISEAVGPIPKWDAGLKQALSGRPIYETFALNGRSASRAAQRVDSSSGETWVTVSIVDRRPTMKAVQEQRQYFAWGLLLASLLSFLLSWVVLTFALGHVQQMVDDVRIVKIKGPGRRLAIPPEGSELSQLAQLLNDMLEKIDQSFHQLKRFTAHAGHELRTPLTRMRGEAELALSDSDPTKAAETMASLLEEISELSRVIDALLELAMEETDLHNSEQLCLQELVTELVEEFSLLAASEGRSLHARISEERTIIRGNRALISRVLWNLFSNALKYSKPGTEIEFTLTSANSTAQIEVQNEMARALEHSAEKLFEPFYREPKQSSDTRGHGLGLALSRSILKRHQGTLVAQALQSKKIRFSASLPLDKQATNLQ